VIQISDPRHLCILWVRCHDIVCLLIKYQQ
jgi:hypothetical protein